MQSSLVKIQHPSKPCLTLNLRNLELFQDEEQGNENNKTPIENVDSKERFCSALKRPCIKVGTPQLIKEGRLKQVDKKKNELMKQLMGEEITAAITKKIMQTEPAENELLRQLEEISTTPSHFNRKFFHYRSFSRPRDHIKIEQFIGDKQTLKGDNQRILPCQQQQRFTSVERSRSTQLKDLIEEKITTSKSDIFNNNTNVPPQKISQKPKESIYYYNHYEGNSDRSSKIFGQLLLSPLKKEQKSEQNYQFQPEQFKMLSHIKPRRPSLIAHHKHSFRQYIHDIAPKSQSGSSFLLKTTTFQEISPVSHKNNTITQITDIRREKETKVFQINNYVLDEQDDYGIDSYVGDNRHKM